MTKVTRVNTAFNRYVGLANQVNNLLSGYNNVKNIYIDIKNRIQEHNNYFISIGFNDAIFPRIAKHITRNTLEEHDRKNIASTPDGFIFSFRPSDSALIDIKGTPIYIFVSKEDSLSKDGRYAGMNLTAPSYLEFKCTTREQYEIVDAWLEELRLEHYTKDTRPKIYVASTWDEWSEYGRIPPRPLDSIILKTGQMERILDDIRLFIESEDDYHDAGLPYHRGYMLYGPPGTGKTSLLMALATKLDMNICFISSSSLKTDKAITELFSYIPKNSILVIEDIDTSFAVQDRQKNDATQTERTSLSVMLNTMDGITTPNGMILFMTTNDLTVIDKAILRPGRIDRLEEIGYLDADQLDRMITRFLGNKFELNCDQDITEMDIAPSDISELFKSCLTDRGGIVDRVHEYVEGCKTKVVV